MAALPAEALHVGDRHALYAQCAQGFTHFLELKGLDDGGYEFHELLPLCSASRNRAAREHWARARLNSRPHPLCKPPARWDLVASARAHERQGITKDVEKRLPSRALSSFRPR